jgi:replicative DNA helicase Mcm
MVRIAEASARAQLKDEVDEEDAQRAIDLLTYTLEQVGMDPETGDFDIDRIESGVSSSQRNRIQTIKHLIDELSGDDGSAEIEEVIEQAEAEDIKPEKTEEVIEKLKKEGELFEPKQGFVQKI